MHRERGIETEPCSEGGRAVSHVEDGDWVQVAGVDFGAGASRFDARVASASGGGRLELRLDGATGTLIGTCAVSGTGGWQTWATVSCDVAGAAGVHDLYLVFRGGSGSLFNLNWWRFVPARGGSSGGGSSSSGSSGSSSSGGTSSGGEGHARSFAVGGCSSAPPGGWIAALALASAALRRRGQRRGG